ncbi:hypothetical protein IWQ62_000431 [Dispira parvispora]|uniref:NADP-dependent oxidoreductase domain-containing protein n=1 Tax=Dispira parvispora TaxID=1520584 RepID=A0A9W8B067_9FUNG|nr:hypothetical protein IWQ62_000431 [Dispira parvispora]
MASNRTFTLATGAKLPALGLGTWKSTPDKVKEAVKVALETGYRHIDCAPVYCNEAAIGEAIIQSQVPRDQLWITSKLWCTEYHPKDVLPACEQTLKDLQLDYLDLYLLHWPFAFLKEGDQCCTAKRDSNGKPQLDTTVNLAETWKAMEELVHLGKVKHIGVANFNVAQLQDLIAGATIKPAVCQAEGHLYCQNTKLVEYCQAQGIQFLAYGPLGTSFCSTHVLANPILLQIASSTQRTAAQVALAWAVQRGTAAIPKSVTPDRIRENFQNDLVLSPEQMSQLAAITTKMRVCIPYDTWNIPKGTLFDD